MKKFKFSFVAIALIAMASAFTVKENSKFADYFVTGNPDASNQYTIQDLPEENCVLSNAGTHCQISSSATPSAGKITAVGATLKGRRP